MDPLAEITVLLRRTAVGDRAAHDRLIELVYGELRSIAAGQLRGSAEPTLQPTALVHEAWLRLLASAPRAFEDRRHFFCTASRAMRSVLIDHARARRSSRRVPLPEESLLDAAIEHLEGGEADLLDLDDALAELERDDPDLAVLVELRFFGGLGHPEISEILDCSLSTVERGWRAAKARLHRRLAGDRAP